MKRIVVLLGAAAIALTACSAKTPTGIESPTPSGSALSPSPSPSRPKPKAPVARSAVYAADDAIWAYDVKANSLSQVAKGEGISLPKFVSATEVSFLQESGGGSVLRLIDLTTREVRDVFSRSTSIGTYGWSPDRQTVAYITTDDRAYPHLHFRSLVGDGATQTVTTLARALGREGDINDQVRIEYSPDGGLVLVVYTPADGEPGSDAPIPGDAAQLQIRSADGSLAYAPDQGLEPTMAAWSADGKRVWFRTRTATRAWVAATGRIEFLRSGAGWYDPWPSRDGRAIAFDAGASSTSVTVRVLDLKTGKRTTVSKAGYFHPVFADGSTIWAQRVQRCEPDCLDPIVPGPEVIAIDLKTGKQRKLALKTLVGVDVLYA